jgi:hypothetical protein
MASKDITVTVATSLLFSEEEYVMILSYFEESLLRCYKHKGLKVTNIHQQPASDFDQDIPADTIACAKGIMGKCLAALKTIYENKENSDGGGGV